MLYFLALLFRAPVNFQFSVVEMVDQDLISPREPKWVTCSRNLLAGHVKFCHLALCI